MGRPAAMPQRIQLHRTKGWRLPDGAVVVSRPSRWGNPFRIGDPKTPDRATAVRQFADAITARQRGDHVAALSKYPSDEEIRSELKGHDLACWCPIGEPCHAEVLLRVAAGTSPTTGP